MRKLILPIIILLSSLCFSQTTSVTLQVTDTPDGQAWNSGTWQVQLLPLTGNINNTIFKIVGSGLPVPNLTQSGALSGSAGASLTLTPTTVINPIGSLWKFTVCPQASAPCFSQAVSIFGATQTVTITPSSIRINATINDSINLAYTDLEVNTSIGQLYYNLGLAAFRSCAAVLCTGGLGYVTIGSGGGGSGCITNPSDGGCAINGTPSVDLFINGVGAGTGWIFQGLATGIQTSVPLTVNAGAATSVISIQCGADPGTGSNVAITVLSPCTPYTLYLPVSPSSGYLQVTQSGSKLSGIWENAINLNSSDVTGVLPITGGGTGASTNSSALIDLFPTPVKAGDVIYWNGTVWNNFGGCAVSACIFSENGNGVPGWLQTPILPASGGTGVSAPTVNTVYKGQGTGAWTATAIVDNGTNVTISEPIIVSSCTGCGGGGGAALNGITAATGSNTLANGNNGAQIWNWAPTTNRVQFQFGETTAATGGTLGTQYLLDAVTLAGSTEVPWGISNSLSGSQTLPTEYITPTWNTTGVVSGGITENITCTAAAANSSGLNIAVGGTPTLSYVFTGSACTLPQLQTTGQILLNGGGNQDTISTGTNQNLYLLPNGTGQVTVPLGSATAAGILGLGNAAGSGISILSATNINYVNSANKSYIKFSSGSGGSAGVQVNTNEGFAWSNNATDATTAAQGCLNMPVSTQFELSTNCGGDLATAAPALWTLQTQGLVSGTTSNSPGSAFVLQSGVGTGTGTPSYIAQKGTFTQSSGATNAQGTVLRHITNDYKTLSTTNTTSSNLITLNTSISASPAGVLIHFQAVFKSSTDTCVYQGTLSAATIDNSGTIKTALSNSAGTDTVSLCSGADTIALVFALSSSTASVLSVTPTWATIVPTSAYIILDYDDFGETSSTL